MRVFIFLFFFGFMITSCSEDPQSDNNQTCTPVVISQSTFNSLEDDVYTIQDLTIEGDCLKIPISFSGCDDDHTFNMVTDGGVDESSPVQITFVLQDNNPQDCEALITIDTEHDLTPLQDLVEGDILIRFRDTDRTILYQP